MSAIVVQVAMAEEAQPFIDAASEASEPLAFGRAQHRGLVIGEATIVLVTSGIGFINAADAAAGALARYGDDALIISAGTAGGLAGTAVGDVIIGTRFVNVEADARAFGYELGQVPGMPAAYEPDAQAVTALVASAPTGLAIVRGEIGSGEKFVTQELAAQLREAFPQLLAVDMETSAIAQLAHNHDARFASVRAISDLCAPTGDEFKTHLDGAAALSAQTVIAALPGLTVR